MCDDEPTSRRHTPGSFWWAQEARKRSGNFLLIYASHSFTQSLRRDENLIFGHRTVRERNLCINFPSNFIGKMRTRGLDSCGVFSAGFAFLSVARVAKNQLRSGYTHQPSWCCSMVWVLRHASLLFYLLSPIGRYVRCVRTTKAFQAYPALCHYAS